MADVDFGTELSCITDIASDGRMVSGFTVVAEAIARRWTTPRGQLIGYPNYGFDIQAYLNGDISARELAELRAGAESEALQDPRVEACTVTTTLETDGALTLTGKIVTGAGPFELVCSVTSVTLALISITPEV